MRGFNLDQLGTFVEVIERGSFSAAADRLDLTQPAVSLQVRQLEKRLGVRLIERVGRRARPTPAGGELLVHARHIAEAVAAAQESLAPYASGAIGRVRIGSGATACIHFLPSVLRDLRQRICRPLDKPLIPKTHGQPVCEYDAMIDAEVFGDTGLQPVLH